MAKNTVPLSGRVPEPLKEKVEELAEEREMSRSAMTRELIKDGIEEIENEQAAQSNRPRSVSPLTILGVVAIAVAPTLLATGYTGLGIAFGAVGAVYALLWVTAYDLALERYLDGVRDQLDDAGGVVGFFRLMWFDHHVEDPDTIVERAARLDLYAPIAGGLALLVGGAAVVLYSLGYFAAVAGVIGPWGVFGWGLLVLGFAYLFAVMLAISALASIAIATAASSTPAADAGTDPDA